MKSPISPKSPQQCSLPPPTSLRTVTAAFPQTKQLHKGVVNPANPISHQSTAASSLAPFLPYHQIKNPSTGAR